MTTSALEAQILPEDNFSAAFAEGAEAGQTADAQRFLQALFAGQDLKSVHLLSVAADPGQSKSWHGGRLGNGYTLKPGENWYYSIAVLDPAATGRSVASLSTHVALVFDDVGTGAGAKVSRIKLEGLRAAGFEPLAIIETSPGNEQWVFKLDRPVPEDGGEANLVLANLRDHFKNEGWGDPACFDPVRYMRLPGGVNGKPAYANPLNGAPFDVRLVHSNWTAAIDLYRMAEHVVGPDFLLKSRSTPVARQVAAGGTPSRSASMDDPLVKLALEVGLNPRPSSRAGVIECDCPNQVLNGDHSDNDPGGFAFIGDGVAKCHHGHCEHLNSTDFQAMIESMFDAQAALGQVVSGASTAREFLARERFLNEPFDPAQVAYYGLDVSPAKTLTLAPVQPLSARTIPPREWLYGRALIRGYISMLVAPGGAGKSALTMAEVVAMATDQELLAGDAPIKPLRVWYHNAEDDGLEMQRRLLATLTHHQVSHADLNGNVILTSGRDLPLMLARLGRDGPEIQRDTIERVVSECRRLGVDVLVLDPLGALHTLPENSNEAVNLLMAALREIADRARVAIGLVHHTSKAASSDMDSAGAGASRGASAFVDAARNVRQLVRMTVKEAQNFGIPEDQRRDYLRVENGKANLARAENARWLRLVSVSLNNGSGHWPQGDTVQTVERWTAPAVTLGSATDLIRVHHAIAQATKHGERPRKSDKSPDWIGYLVAGVLDVDIGGHDVQAKDREPAQNLARTHVRRVLAQWVQDGGIIYVFDRDGRNGRDAEFAAPGAAPTPDETSPPEFPQGDA